MKPQKKTNQTKANGTKPANSSEEPIRLSEVFSSKTDRYELEERSRSFSNSVRSSFASDELRTLHQFGIMNRVVSDARDHLDREFVKFIKDHNVSFDLTVPMKEFKDLMNDVAKFGKIGSKAALILILPRIQKIMRSAKLNDAVTVTMPVEFKITMSEFDEILEKFGISRMQAWSLSKFGTRVPSARDVFSVLSDYLPELMDAVPSLISLLNDITDQGGRRYTGDIDNVNPINKEDW